MMNDGCSVTEDEALLPYARTITATYIFTYLSHRALHKEPRDITVFVALGLNPECFNAI